MLRNIKLTNFKCFEKLDLNCTPLNLLCGLNGMGKSSVIQALLVLQQSFEIGELSQGRLVLGGTRVDLGAALDVLFEDADREEVGFALQSDATSDKCELFFGYSSTSDQLSVVVQDADASVSYVPMEWQDEPPFGGNLVYVNAERVGSRKLYPLSSVLARRADFGASGEYAWNYLSHHQDDLLLGDDPRCGKNASRRLLAVLNLWLQDVSPGVHLQLDPVTAADVVVAGFSFDRPGDVASRRHRATNVGFGLSYVLPVILALLSPPGALCLIENPEAHLHPRGQTRLADLAARAAMAGVQVFVETHSDHFVDGIRIAVRDGIIPPADVALSYFEREDNKTIIVSPRLDRAGRLSAWPAGFFDQHEENLARLIAPRS